MNDRPTEKLTSEEAGAFAAQWAEHRSVTADELARRLQIEASSVESLLKLLTGRLSMAKWAAQKVSSAAPVFSYATIATVSAACLMIGGLLTYFLFPKTSSSRPVAAVGGEAGSFGLHPMVRGGFGGPPLQTSDFRPVPGDGDPVQRIGLMAGADIARSTSGAAPVAGATSDPAGQPPIPLTGHLVSGGAEAPRRMDFDDHKGVLAFPFTQTLLSKGVQIPNDIVIWIRTPAAVYTVEGRKTSNEVAVESWKIEDLLSALGELMTLSMIHSPPVPGQAPATHGPPSEIILRVGRAYRSLPIEWSQQNQDRLLSMFAIPVTNDAKKLIQPFLDTIRQSGKDLFR